MSYKSSLDLIYFFHDAILASFVVGLVLGIVGVYLHLRRNIFLAAVLPQVAGCGFVIANALGMSEILGGTFTLLFFILVIAFQNKSWEKLGITKECVIGAGFVLAVAVNIIVASIIAKETHSAELMAKGSILTITCYDLYKLVIIGIPIVGALIFLRKRFFLVYLDPECALTQGYNTDLYEGVFYILISIVIMITVKSAGAVASFSLLLFAPLTALAISKKSYYIFIISGIIGGLSSIIGVLLAILLDLPAGPMIILNSCIIWLITMIIVRITKVI